MRPLLPISTIAFLPFLPTFLTALSSGWIAFYPSIVSAWWSREIYCPNFRTFRNGQGGTDFVLSGLTGFGLLLLLIFLPVCWKLIWKWEENWAKSVCGVWAHIRRANFSPSIAVLEGSDEWWEVKKTSSQDADKTCFFSFLLVFLDT